MTCFGLNYPEIAIIAGMPSASLTELAKVRLEVISFFFFAFFLFGWLLKGMWNLLARDFSWMPTISYRQGLAIFGVAGLFLYVVLTMISGARELMTPGAWEKDGATYRLATKDEKLSEETRKAALRNLAVYLDAWSVQHERNLPAERFEPDIPAYAWISGDGMGIPFEYVARKERAKSDDIVAYEPASVGPIRFVLFGDGRIEARHWEDIAKRIFASDYDEEKG